MVRYFSIMSLLLFDLLLVTFHHMHLKKFIVLVYQCPVLFNLGHGAGLKSESQISPVTKYNKWHPGKIYSSFLLLFFINFE